MAPKPKKTPSRPKRVSRSSPVVTDSDRRRSARSRKSETKYVERDSSEDDEEMWEGVAEWKYLKKSQGEGSDGESEAESAVSAATPAPTRAPKKKPEAPPAASATTQGSDDSELSELDSQEIELEEQEEEESSPPPAKANGKRTDARGGARKPSGAAASKPKPSPKNGKPLSKAAPPPPGKSTRLTRRQKTKSDEYAMDESDD
jgi:sister-chromatid-cohesion protein PDS5